MKFENFFVAALFALSILIGAGLGFVGAVDSAHSKSISQQENRALADFPRLKSVRRDLSAFPALFEKFYDDHFLLRLPLTIFRNYLNYAILHSSGNASVAIGRSQWLFYSLGKLPEAQQNLAPYDPPELDGALKTFCARRDLLAQHGCTYIVLIAPEKGTIYPELMPKGWCRKQGQSRLEQLQNAFAKEHINYVNASKVLSDARRKNDNKQLYFSKDSHWNRYGAFLVAQSLFADLHQKNPALEPFSANEFKMVEDNHVGDLTGLLGIQSLLTDKDNLAASIAVEKAHEVDNRLLPRFDGGVIESVGEPKAYRVESRLLPSAFIFHDSFMEFLQPYLIEKFSFSQFHLARSLNLDAAISQKPNIVIDEIAERHLYDRGFDNVVTFIDPMSIKETEQPAQCVAAFQKQWQLVSVKPTYFKHSLGVELHWRALADGVLKDTVQVSLLNGATKEACGATAYKQDMFERSIKSGQEWTDVIPVTFFANSEFDQIGIMVTKDAKALYCEAPNCDYKVRAICKLNGLRAKL